MLCEKHKDEPRLAEPVEKRCLMHNNYNEITLVYYENSQICETCSENTDFCVICQEAV